MNINPLRKLLILICPPLGFFLNFLLIWLILAKTPKEMLVHSRILLQTCIFDIIFLLQMTIGSPVAVRFNDVYIVFFDGYFPSLLKQFCSFGLFLLLNFHMCLFSIDVLSVIVQFLYRYLLFNCNIKITLFRYFQLLSPLIILCVFVTSIFLIHHASSLIDGIRMEDEQIVAEIFELKEIDGICFTIVENVNIVDQLWFILVIFILFIYIFAIIFLGWRIVRFVQMQ